MLCLVGGCALAVDNRLAGIEIRIYSHCAHSSTVFVYMCMNMHPKNNNVSALPRYKTVS